MGEALLRDVAAVDHQLGPGDERCLVGGEEKHAISNFDRLTEAAEWSERNLVGTLIGIGRIQHWRHIAGMHRIDANAQGAIAYRRRFRIDPHSAFRGAIGGMAAGAADKAHDRADVDDRTAAGLRHLLGGELGAEKDAVWLTAMIRCQPSRPSGSPTELPEIPALFTRMS